jgi:DNA-binding NtrC family response regulator
MIENQLITKKTSISTVSDSKEKTTILHIDDEPESLEITKLFLELLDSKLKVISTKSHEEFFEVLQNCKIEAIIADYLMPNMNGLDILERVRREKINIPFIIFTGRGRKEIAISAFNMGAIAYVDKATNVRSRYRELYKAVNSAVRRFTHNLEPQ